jgi:hypothetical protein
LSIILLALLLLHFLARSALLRVSACVKEDIEREKSDTRCVDLCIKGLNNSFNFDKTAHKGVKKGIKSRSVFFLFFNITESETECVTLRRVVRV